MQTGLRPEGCDQLGIAKMLALGGAATPTEEAWVAAARAAAWARE